MVLRIAPLLLSAGASLWAADPSLPAAPQKVTVTHTETLSLPAGGTVRIEHSVGELGIEGWDRPDVEITVIKTTQDFYSAADHAKGTAENRARPRIGCDEWKGRGGYYGLSPSCFPVQHGAGGGGR